MRRAKRKPVYYSVSSMHDGTILSAHPVRKTHAKSMKMMGMRLDEENVCTEFTGNYVGVFNCSRNPGDARFFDIITNRLNTRRAIRELVLPELTAIRQALENIATRLDALERANGAQTTQ